jgi:hypothetical protein
MSDAFYCFTVDDVGYPGYSSPAHMETILQFCADEDIRATFFVVPRPLGQELSRHEYAGLFQTMLKAGHAIGQHGLEHDRFGFGIPPKMVLDLPHERPAREYLADHRDDIERLHAVETLRARLRTGRTILEDVLGQPVDGFRAPCLSTCDNLFVALNAEGYAYDSSQCFQKGAWDLINGSNSPAICPITRELFDSHQTPGRMRTFPLSAEYTWYLTRERFGAFLQLAKHDFDACLNAGIPFVPVCHVSPIQEGDADCGFALHRELLAHARERANSQGKRLVGAALSELSRNWQW